MTEQSARTALITGAASGIGAAIAGRLAGNGWRLVLVDRDKDRLADLAGRLDGRELATLVLDVTDAAAVAALPERIPEALRPVTALINNAGHDIGGTTRFDQGSADEWANVIETNLIGMMRVTRALLPDMVARNAGDIVNMGSISGLRVVPDMAAYTASKFGVRGFTDTLRGDLQDTAIRVTEIRPGLTRTNIISTRYRGDDARADAYFDRFKMALDPEDIAHVVAFALDMPPHAQVAHLTVVPVNRF